MKFLLDYVFPITVITPTVAASTAFLKQACLVATPKSGQEGNVGTIYECTTMTQVAARTDNANAQQLFNAGMSKVYILLADDLDLEDYITEGLGSDFYTLLVSDDFADADIEDAQAEGTYTITSYANLVSGTDDVITVGGVAFTAQVGAATLGAATFQAATSNDATATSLAAQINAHATTSALVTAEAAGAVVTLTANDAGASGNAITTTYTDNDTNVGATVSGATLTGGAGIILGTWEGVVGVSSDDEDFCEDQAIIENRVCFFTSSANGAKNMCYAFGKLLSATNWKNQQYITMPFDDGIANLGDAESLFDDKVSFVITDDEYSNKLSLFAVGGRAIVSPYILKNLRVDLQSRALSWISANQPQYTIKEASLLETRLKEDVINDLYVLRNLITAGTVAISLVNENFVATGAINVAPPKGLWRVESEMQQTL
jgi:hypothetical protein